MLTCVQLGDFVVVPSYVVGYIPHKILGNDRLDIKCQFHTIVFQRTDILKETVAKVGTSGNVYY